MQLTEATMKAITRVSEVYMSNQFLQHLVITNIEKDNIIQSLDTTHIL